MVSRANQDKYVVEVAGQALHSAPKPSLKRLIGYSYRRQKRAHALPVRRFASASSAAMRASTSILYFLGVENCYRDHMRKILVLHYTL